MIGSREEAELSLWAAILLYKAIDIRTVGPVQQLSNGGGGERAVVAAGLAGEGFVQERMVCRVNLVDGASQSLVGLGWSQLCLIRWSPL